MPASLDDLQESRNFQCVNCSASMTYQEASKHTLCSTCRLDPTAPPEEMMRGYLKKRKQQSKTLSAWTKRWFFIDNFQLRYRAKQDSSQSKLAVAIKDVIEVSTYSHKDTKGLSCFKVETNSTERDDILLRAESQQEVGRWIRGFKTRIRMWESSSPSSHQTKKKRSARRLSIPDSGVPTTVTRTQSRQPPIPGPSIPDDYVMHAHRRSPSSNFLEKLSPHRDSKNSSKSSSSPTSSQSTRQRKKRDVSKNRIQGPTVLDVQSSIFDSGDAGQSSGDSLSRLMSNSKIPTPEKSPPPAKTAYVRSPSRPSKGGHDVPYHDFAEIDANDVVTPQKPKKKTRQKSRRKSREPDSPSVDNLALELGVKVVVASDDDSQSDDCRESDDEQEPHATPNGYRAAPVVRADSQFANDDNWDDSDDDEDGDLSSDPEPQPEPEPEPQPSAQPVAVAAPPASKGEWDNWDDSD